MTSPNATSTGSPSAGSAVGVWHMVAWISGVFSVLVALTMFLGEVKYEPVSSLTSPQLAALKASLRREPNNESIKKSIRELDLRQRRHYFRQLSQMHSGAYLLLAGVAAFVFAVTRISRFHKQLPMPKPSSEATDQAQIDSAHGRWAVAVIGAAIGLFLFGLQLVVSNAVPEKQAAVEKLFGTAQAATVESDAAAVAELKKNWPRFRGFEGSGVSAYTNAPTSWDAKAGTGIAWKATVPAPGFNSPITWGDRIFFSGGNATKREVFCLDARNGQTVWQLDITKLPGTPPPPEIPETTGYAACTLATDGKRVYVMFANGDLAAVSMDGKLVWGKSFGPLKNPYGYATSLATWKDRVILQLDQGESDDNKSKLYAIDGHNGQTVWERPRKVGSSWATPIVIEAAGKAQIITLAVPKVMAYSATDGAELWSVDCLNGEITPSPVYAGGLVILPSPSDRLVAIRPNGQGDVTKTAVAWTSEENVPDVTSPVATSELVFTVTTPGMLTCFDATNGKKLWEHDYDMEIHASPGISGDRVYLFGQKGAAIIVQAGREFKELFRTEMGDAFHASPVFLDGKIIMRGTTNIWCLGPPSKSP